MRIALKLVWSKSQNGSLLKTNSKAGFKWDNS